MKCWDGDDGQYVETAPNAKGTHFYNAAGKDFFGKPTTVVTYVMGKEQKSNGTARDHAAKHLALKDPETTVAKLLADPTCSTLKGKAAAYSLGLALHYLTVMTQPMHSSSYSAVQMPLMLHAVWEEYVPSIQAKYAAGTTEKWRLDGKFKGLTPDAAFVAVAKAGNAQAPALARALKPGGATICTMTGEAKATYTGYCWAHDAAADAAAGKVLREAFQLTAGYLFAVFNAGTRPVTPAPPRPD